MLVLGCVGVGKQSLVGCDRGVDGFYLLDRVMMLSYLVYFVRI